MASNLAVAAAYQESLSELLFWALVTSEPSVEPPKVKETPNYTNFLKEEEPQFFTAEKHGENPIRYTDPSGLNGDDDEDKGYNYPNESEYHNPNSPLVYGADFESGGPESEGIQAPTGDTDKSATSPVTGPKSVAPTDVASKPITNPTPPANNPRIPQTGALGGSGGPPKGYLPAGYAGINPPTNLVPVTQSPGPRSASDGKEPEGSSYVNDGIGVVRQGHSYSDDDPIDRFFFGVAKAAYDSIAFPVARARGENYAYSFDGRLIDDSASNKGAMAAGLVSLLSVLAEGEVAAVKGGTLAAGKGLTTAEQLAQRGVTGFTSHGLERAAVERGFTEERILQVLSEGKPVTATGKYGTPQIRYTLGQNTVVVETAGRNANKVVTVFSPGEGGVWINP